MVAFECWIMLRVRVRYSVWSRVEFRSSKSGGFDAEQ